MLAHLSQALNLCPDFQSKHTNWLLPPLIPLTVLRFPTMKFLHQQ